MILTIERGVATDVFIPLAKEHLKFFLIFSRMDKFWLNTWIGAALIFWNFVIIFVRIFNSSHTEHIYFISTSLTLKNSLG